MSGHAGTLISGLLIVSSVEARWKLHSCGYNTQPLLQHLRHLVPFLPPDVSSCEDLAVAVFIYLIGFRPNDLIPFCSKHCFINFILNLFPLDCRVTPTPPIPPPSPPGSTLLGGSTVEV